MTFVLGYVGAPDASSRLLAFLALLAILAARRYLWRALDNQG